ncbi:MAG: tRNA-dihydrouridine synthase [Patescibacteria group bacterium]|nr:tRNA-dihydrouridine synthase [Patescibacteria group bacterium]
MPKKTTLGFWSKLKKPIMCLAPMSDVTDSAFRQIIAKYGKPDVFFTEFVSVAGLASLNRDKVAKTLYFTRKERPIVAQVWGSEPEQFYESTRLIRKLGFDGLDINMGCPDRAVEKQGAGAALMKNPKLAWEIIKAAKRGAGPLPVSIKTRIGYNSNILEEWLPGLLQTEPAVLTIHARTRMQMSKVRADWNLIALAVKIRNQLKSRTLIVGNGDIQSLDQARLRTEETGVDGIMVGRAIFGNPWFFNAKKHIEDISLKERLLVLAEHTRLFEKLYRGQKNFDTMKKHFKAYASGFNGAKALRVKLMACKNADEVQNTINNYINIGGRDILRLP